MYSFERIPIKELDRNEYNGFSDKHIFTTMPWVRFIAEDQREEPIILRITDKGVFRGYFTGLLVKKFGLRILGSPFRGWSTSYMGFDVFTKEEKTRILPEFIKYAFVNLKCHYIELADRSITLEEAKKTGYVFYPINSIEIDISRAEEEMFRSFKSDGRNFIRQFMRKGANVEECTPNDFFAEEYFNQLKDVFAKQHLTPTYGLSKVKRLLRSLCTDDMVLCLRATDPSGKSIATGIFPGYNNTFYFWGGASYRASQFYRPNEGIQWYAIRYWKKKGISCYDMGGMRDYKMKFGPSKTSYPCFMIAKYPALLKLRNFAETLYFVYFRFKGRFVEIMKSSFNLGQKCPVRSYRITMKQNCNQKSENSKLSQISSLLNHKKPLCFYDNNLLLSYNKELFSLNLNSLEIESIASIPGNNLFSFLGKNRYLNRLLRSEIHYAVYTQGKIYFVYAKKVFSFDTVNHTFSVERIFNRGKGPLKMTVVNQGFGSFNTGIYYGEYFNNPNKEQVNIYFNSLSNPEWINLFSFPQGSINHIHSIIPDPFRNYMWILTGDFEDAAGMWIASEDFKDVIPIATGKQIYRACVAFPTQQGMIYATDSQLERNYICLLHEKESGWESTRLHEINGSCIYGCKVGKHFVFSTSTEPGMEKKSIICSLLDREPGPGILKNESHLLLLDENLKLTILDKKKKDWLPYRLFQFGTFMFPSGNNKSNYLFSYSVANIGNDLSTGVWELI